MTRARTFLAAGLALALTSAAPARAAPLTISKTSQVVSDPMGNALPKAVPGAVVDYTITIANPASNVLTTVNGIVLTEAIPARTELRVADLGLLSSGPVAFNGSLLGLSGLGYGFNGLASMSDSIDFSADGGATWTYQPVADAGGYDRRVTNIRVRLSGSQTAGTSASVRFRVRLR